MPRVETAAWIWGLALPLREEEGADCFLLPGAVGRRAGQLCAKVRSPFGVWILGCWRVKEVLSSNVRESVSCPSPGGARRRAGATQGRRKPISAAFAVHVKSDRRRGVPGESLMSLDSGMMQVSGRSEKNDLENK